MSGRGFGGGRRGGGRGRGRGQRQWARETPLELFPVPRNAMSLSLSNSCKALRFSFGGGKIDRLRNYQEIKDFEPVKPSMDEVRKYSQFASWSINLQSFCETSPYYYEDSSRCLESTFTLFPFMCFSRFLCLGNFGLTLAAVGKLCHDHDLR